ncbi:flavodoxin family protein [uncultured Veillonella sp.]|uniref:flavodoxin family protein n=1 Tax=uncultured Veillonella sp. TaxID=159268 RepID=UPI002639A498|nr:flavodoxin family protein [uncultured Veillonella sp.]
MAKQILILNGTSRKKGNTAALTASFRKGAEEKGHKVQEIFVDDLTINSCVGCNQCTKRGAEPNPCIQKDDMIKVYEGFNGADIIVLASPIYYWAITGALKTVVDRTYALSHSNGGIMPKKDVAFIAAAASDEFDEVVTWYNVVTNYLQWNRRGMVLCDDVVNVGDAQAREDKLKEAYELGISL